MSCSGMRASRPFCIIVSNRPSTRRWRMSGAGRSRELRSWRISDRTSEQTQYICCERLMGSFSPAKPAAPPQVRACGPKWATRPRLNFESSRSLASLDRDQPQVDLLGIDRLIDRNGARPEDIVPVIASLIDPEVDQAGLYRDGARGSVLDPDPYAGHGGVQDVADLGPRPDLEEARQA